MYTCIIDITHINLTAYMVDSIRSYGKQDKTTLALPLLVRDLCDQCLNLSLACSFLLSPFGPQSP